MAIGAAMIVWGESGPEALPGAPPGAPPPQWDQGEIGARGPTCAAAPWPFQALLMLLLLLLPLPLPLLPIVCILLVLLVFLLLVPVLVLLIDDRQQDSAGGDGIGHVFNARGHSAVGVARCQLHAHVVAALAPLLNRIFLLLLLNGAEPDHALQRCVERCIERQAKPVGHSSLPLGRRAIGSPTPRPSPSTARRGRS